MYLRVVNISDTDMWVNFASAATTGQGSVPVRANGGYYESADFAPTDAVNIICTAGGKAFTIKEG